MSGFTSTLSREAYERTVKAWPESAMWPLARIGRYTTNPRRNDAAVADVMQSLVAYAARQPIVVWKDDIIIVGDTRWLAAEALGWPSFPVHTAYDLSEAEAIGYRLADNKTGERAEWDFPLLSGEFTKLQGLGFPLDLTGFRDFEIEPIMASEWVAPTTEPMPEVGTSGDDKAKKDSTQVVHFNDICWEQVGLAVEAMRAARAVPTLTPEDVLTRLCMGYLAAPSAEEET